MQFHLKWRSYDVALNDWLIIDLFQFLFVIIVFASFRGQFCMKSLHDR